MKTVLLSALLFVFLGLVLIPYNDLETDEVIFGQQERSPTRKDTKMNRSASWPTQRALDIPSLPFPTHDGQSVAPDGPWAWHPDCVPKPKHVE